MLLEIDHVRVAYGRSVVLHGTTTGVAEGEVLGLLGRNGMGKTTLVHTVVGFLRPSAGVIRLGGDEIHGLAPERIARAGITLVPQGRRVFGSLTVGETLGLAYRDRGGAAKWTPDQVFERFPILKDRSSQHAGLLSGGQQQMLAIGRALLGNGRLIIMDEPTEGLDPKRVELVGGVIDELRERRTTVLLVEQRVKFALQHADRIDILSRGVVVERTTPAELEAHPETMSRYLAVA
jgi:branched-chain amino acid transport system ATP-binding protein